MGIPALEKLTPGCFGSEQWSTQDLECRGGLDPAYLDPTTNERRRPECPFYRACGARCQAAETVKLLLPRAPEHVPLRTQPTTAPTLYPPRRPETQPYRSAEFTRPVQSQPVTVYAPTPAAPGNFANYPVPPFLSTPEPRGGGEPWYTLMLRAAARAAFKGAALGIAHIIDTTPWFDDRH